MANLQAGLEAGDDAATGVSGLFRSRYPFPGQPRTGGIRVFRYPAHTLEPSAGTMMAYLLSGRVEGISGHIVGFWDSSSGAAISDVPADGPPAVKVVGGDFPEHARQMYFYGYAHENVRRVVLRLSGGRQYGAQAFAAWPGSGLRLWAIPVPVGTLTSSASRVMVGYDAAGRMVWQQNLLAAR